MQHTIHEIRSRFQSDLGQARTTADVEELRVRYLGRKGPVQDLMKELKGVSNEERPAVGKAINDLKVELTARCDEAMARFSQGELTERLKRETLDITLPGRRQRRGTKHIVNQTMDEIIDILIEMGFTVQEGPEVETEYYNFEALNFAPDHPARDMQDTFYINDEFLLRTQTSNIQVRVMEANKPPIRIICPGRAYRNETVTARSHVFFHQVEGFYIDKNVSFAHLLATIDEFLHKLMGPDVQIRYRPSYFPFVEPGLEVDVSCSLCGGKGCSMCKGTGWVEVLGAGMIHPEVLKNGGIDPEEYSGYAWGMGVERLVNIKYGVNDIRRFTENDLRFLQQFHGV
jgi:phenylalanyl-tRNA synthetase alpha chain